MSLSFFPLLGIDPGGGTELLQPPGFCPSLSHMIGPQKGALKAEQSIGSVASGPSLLPILPFLHFHGFFFLFSFLKDLHSRPKKTFFLGDELKLKDWHDKEAIRRDSQRVGMEGRAECGHCANMLPWVCAHVSCVSGASGPLVRFLPATILPNSCSHLSPILTSPINTRPTVFKFATFQLASVHVSSRPHTK